MDEHSGTQPAEAVDPPPECPPPGGGTVPMWQLGLRAGPESYPTRPGHPDCIYYLKTGFCGYGNRCRYNHPSDRSMAREVVRAGGGEHPQRAGHPLCKYYMRTGICRFGDTCKYHHPKYETESSSPVKLNIFGYPLREGVEECSFYAKTGQCKFGDICRFHHPQPGYSVVPTLAVYPSGMSPSGQPSQQYSFIQGNWPVASPALFPGSYVHGSYGPLLIPPGVFQVPGWSPYAAPVAQVASPSTQPTVAPRPVFGLTKLSPLAAPYTGPHVSMTSSAGPSSGSQNEHEFPERPGVPECQHFMKTGYCKFGGACKYHHPKKRSAQESNFMLNPVGLPLRPGMKLCPNYAQSGVCVFGALCMFDHPMGTLSYNVSASSLTDAPVVPYPAGSTNVTLAPSTSSVDLRLDLFPVLGNVSSVKSSSTSVGSILSSSGPIPPSSIQQYTSGQGSIKSCEGEVQTSR